MAPIQPKRYRLHLQHRLERWAYAHPEYKAKIEEWIERFQANPYDSALDPLERVHGAETLLEYVIPGVPLVIVVLPERWMDADGIVWAKVLRPGTVVGAYESRGRFRREPCRTAPAHLFQPFAFDQDGTSRDGAATCTDIARFAIRVVSAVIVEVGNAWRDHHRSVYLIPSEIAIVSQAME